MSARTANAGVAVDEARQTRGKVGTLPQSTRRDFSTTGYDEAMRRAREIVPVLRERAQRSEDARGLIRDTEQLLHESGLFRFHQPKAFGGMELPFVAVIDIPAELARGCPSTAWNVGNFACHHWILGYYDPETQREVWDANPDALIASSIALAAGRARKAEGGFIVNGRWPFSSGVDNSDWNMLAVSVYGDDGKPPTDWRLCLVSRADYEIIDTWYAMGMAGTGSTRDTDRGGFQSPRGASGHRRRRGAFELFLETMAKRTGTYTGAKVADFQAVQIKVARARCLIDAARDLLRQSAIAFQDCAARDETPDLQTKLRFRAHSAFAVGQAREAVETLWSCYGAQGLYTRDPLQRHLRDVMAINQHFSFNFDIAGAAFGAQALGGAYGNPTM